MVAGRVPVLVSGTGRVMEVPRSWVPKSSGEGVRVSVEVPVKPRRERNSSGAGGVGRNFDGGDVVVDVENSGVKVMLRVQVAEGASVVQLWVRGNSGVEAMVVMVRGVVPVLVRRTVCEGGGAPRVLAVKVSGAFGRGEDRLEGTAGRVRRSRRAWSCR